MLKWLMLVIYIILIIYVLSRTIHCIRRMNPLGNHKRVYIPYAVIFVVCCATLLLGGLLPYGKLRISLHKISNYWLGYFIYIVFFILLADILRAVLYLINRKKKIAILGTRKEYILIGTAVTVLSISFTIYGLIHADKVYTNTYEVTVEKKAGNLEDLNVALIADLHLGYSIGVKDMQRMVDKVNALEPDIVLVAGDIVDNEYDAMSDPDRIAEVISQIKSTYGVYAVYGNHDVAEILIGGFSITPKSLAFRDPRVEEFVEKCGFKMLEDDVTLVDNSFYVIGRLDGEKPGNGITNRKTTLELMTGLDQSKPIILLSHEPDDLEDNAKAGVDMQLCGHTHAGQFFPLNIVQPLVWKNFWGYLKVGNMHNYVTSGIGIYGPDMRVMTDSEVMQIKVHFE